MYGFRRRITIHAKVAVDRSTGNNYVPFTVVVRSKVVICGRQPLCQGRIQKF